MKTYTIVPTIGRFITESSHVGVTYPSCHCNSLEEAQEKFYGYVEMYKKMFDGIEGQITVSDRKFLSIIKRAKVHYGEISIMLTIHEHEE